MYTFRVWQPRDLAWLEGAAGIAAWEAIPAADRQQVDAVEVIQRARMRLHSIIDNPWGTAFIAQSGHEPVGFILATVGPDTSTDVPQGFLVESWVAPEHRRRGVAGRLQAVAEDWFTRLGLGRVKLWTTIDNEPVLRMAVRRGYRPGGLISMKPLDD